MNQALDQLDAPVVSSDLGFEVGDVVFKVSGPNDQWVCVSRLLTEKLCQFFLLKHAILHDLKTHESCALFF